MPTAVGEQILSASFRLDRHAPSARFVRLRASRGRAFLVVRLPEAATVRVLAGARVVVARKLRRAGIKLTDAAGNSGRAGPFLPRSNG